MNRVRIHQLPAATHDETYTLTVTVGESSHELTFPEGHFFDVTIPCDSLLIERTGTFSDVTVTPDPFSIVCLNGNSPLVAASADSDLFVIFALFVCLFALLFAKQVD